MLICFLLHFAALKTTSTTFSIKASYTNFINFHHSTFYFISIPFISSYSLPLFGSLALFSFLLLLLFLLLFFCYSFVICFLLHFASLKTTQHLLLFSYTLFPPLSSITSLLFLFLSFFSGRFFSGLFLPVLSSSPFNPFRCSLTSPLLTVLSFFYG